MLRGEIMMFRFRRVALAAALILPGLGPLAKPAAADLDACNKTSEHIYVAIAHNSDQGWLSFGWWPIHPKACVTILTENLQYRYYYVYAESDTQLWGGEHNFCIQDLEFDIVGADDCEARGYETVGFHEHDVGGNTDFTVLIGP
jgi:uncharacterized membrane protein